MRKSYEDFADELSRSFPQTPERFRQVVSREVRTHMKPVRHTARRKRRVLLPLAACLILAEVRLRQRVFRYFRTG